MPLLDHFRPPLSPVRHWESFHVNWAGAIADDLNENLLPDGYFAEEQIHLGPRIEIDVATFSEEVRSAAPSDVAVRTWAPPAPNVVIPTAFPDTFEVLVFRSEGGAVLAAAIEMVSPANKDRGEHRQAIAIKCASYLAQGIGLIVVDVVTTRRANLHNEIMALLGQSDGAMPREQNLYATAYRPIVRDQAERIEVWTHSLALGESLPTLPLALNAELCLPIDLEANYSAACLRRRIP